MKPILVDIKDMSDSREVYESRPHPFFICFIYLLLAMTASAIIWAAFFEIDIVVTGTGTVNAKSDSSTITNTKAGIVTKCYIADGQDVAKGDLLYEVEQDELRLELATYENQKKENEERLEMMDGYLKWLNDNNTNLDAYADNSFYKEYSARIKLVLLNSDSVRQEYESQQSTYDAKLQANDTLISYYQNEIEKLNQLSGVIKSRVNTFSDGEAYYCAKANDYLTQFHNTEILYDESISALQNALDEAFSKISETQAAADEADRQIAEANTAINAEPDNLELAAAKQREIEAAQARKSEAQMLASAQETLAREKKEAIATAQSKRQSALSTLETNTIAEMEHSILTCQQNLITARGSQAEVESAQENTLKTGTTGMIENAAQTEIKSVTSEISSCEAKCEELKAAIAGIEKNIRETSVAAPVSGTVNLTEDLVKGNYLTAGTAVMTIIPQKGDGYLVKSYIDNRDIAKIGEDMAVKYEIAAYPSSEYGVLTGNVAFVSADLKASDEIGSAYYMVETTIDDTSIYNAGGEQARLKVGMLCETKIIVDRKSVLRYILEKIRLID